MKRYRILNIDFDSRANLLNLTIEDSWDEKVKQLHRENKEKIKQWLLMEFGSDNAEAKLKNFTDLGAAPFSILSFHNRFFHQTRTAFVIGSYYPALTGACALGERILNHLLRSLRDFYKGTPEYRTVYNKESFDNWDIPIKTLTSWNILQPTAVDSFNKLKDMRNRAIHFRPETDHNDRNLALEAIQTLGRIIDGQFSGFGTRPWFILNTPGTCFLKKESENDPFIKTIYIPNCVLVGPYHKLERRGEQWMPIDNFDYGQKEISDEEFAGLFNDQSSHPKQ